MRTIKSELNMKKSKDVRKTKVNRMKGLDLFKWVERVRKFYLTIGDVEKMKQGETLDVVLLYSELFDHGILKIPRNKMFLPECLKKIAGTYIHKDGITGVLTIMDGIIYSDVPDELQVQIDKSWHNFFDGFLYEYNVKTKMDWKDLPKSTPVGWKGPLIRVSDLKKMPMFYIEELA